MLTRKRPAAWCLLALAIASAAALAVVLGATLSAAQAAPVGKLTQFKVPTAGSSPKHITRASDGNFWFTESFVNDQNALPHKVGRITPAGQVTEFRVCDFLLPDRHSAGLRRDPLLHQERRAAGPDHHRWYGAPRTPASGSPSTATGSTPTATTSGSPTSTTRSVWRYDVQTGVFTEFRRRTRPFDVAVAPNGVVWFTEGDGQIGRIDPGTGVVTEIEVEGFPRQINVAGDGAVWFTERFTRKRLGASTRPPTP